MSRNASMDGTVARFADVVSTFQHRGSVTRSELLDEHGMDPSTLNAHLKILQSKGLVAAVDRRLSKAGGYETVFRWKVRHEVDADEVTA